MQIIENKSINEKVYVEKLDNGLVVMIMPKKTRKKYIAWSANYGSIDNKFYAPGDESITIVPDGIAHYLEHKLFEQRDGTNSLDTLCALGVDANAYTTNDHTAYLYECTENFEEALVEFMDYVQNPYFTDENVEKERGIIGQEIMMYDDYPEWALYMNAMKAMYKENEINIDVAGTKETIAEIDKEKLYKIYNTFYVPGNMIIVLAGDFEPEVTLEKIKENVIMKKEEGLPKRIYNEEPKKIVQKYVEKQMDISMPCVLIGFKDNNLKDDKVKKDIAVEIIGSILLSKSSKTFEELYESGKIFSEPSIQYEFSKTFAHVMIQFQSHEVNDVIETIEENLNCLKNNGILDEDFARAKKKLYGELVKSYSEVSNVASATIADYFKGISSFEYINEFKNIDKTYVENVLRELFIEENKVISVIKPLTNN